MNFVKRELRNLNSRASSSTGHKRIRDQSVEKELHLRVQTGKVKILHVQLICHGCEEVHLG